MAAPLVAAALKYGAGKLLESQGLPSGLVDPKGYLLDKLKGAADTALDLPSGTTSAVVNPKAAIVGAAKDFAKDQALEAIRGSGGGSKVNTDEELSAGDQAFKRGGSVKSAAKSKASSASRRGDGIAQRGKTKGRYL